jgi:hypothetical protein
MKQKVNMDRLLAEVQKLQEVLSKQSIPVYIDSSSERDTSCEIVHIFADEGYSPFRPIGLSYNGKTAHGTFDLLEPIAAQAVSAAGFWQALGDAGYVEHRN